MAQRYRRRPSELLSIDDDYTAYCFDEACAFIAGRLDAGDEIAFNRQYSSFSDLYAQYE
nr:MAG TPA: hypothetical protein [Bacteriophage sp.]